MNRNELVNVFLALEKKYGLNSIEIDGFHPWIYTRFFVFQEILTLESKDAITVNKKDFFLHINDVLSAVFRKKSPLKKADICFISHRGRVMIDGVYECRFTDDLAEVFQNSITLEHISRSYPNFKPTKTQNIAYSDLIVIKSHLYGIFNKYVFFRKFKRIHLKLTELFSEPFMELNHEIETDIKINKWVYEMAIMYFSYKSRYKNYEKFLLKTSPKLIVETVGYNKNNMIINEIAKKIGITTIELAHGIRTSQYLAYSYPDDEHILQFPDKVFCYSDICKEHMACPIKAENIVVTGYAFFEKQVKKFNEKYKEDSNIKRLIFLSPNHSNRELYSKFALDINERLSPQGWKIVFKLHPTECSNWKQNFPLLVNSTIEIIDNPATSIYEIFSKGTALVTSTLTTALFEGFGLGLKAFIYDIISDEDIDVVEKLCKDGYCEIIEDANGLCDALKNIGNYVEKSPFWKSDVLDNIIKEIYLVLN